MSRLVAVLVPLLVTGCGLKRIDVSASQSSSGCIPGTPCISATSDDSQVTVQWDAMSGVAGYNVYRTVPGNANLKLITKCSGQGFVATTCIDTGLVNGSTYLYSARAINADGSLSGYSNQVASIPQIHKPLAPTNLNATAGDTQVSLTWTAPNGATSFTVWRSLNQNSGFVKIPNCTDLYYYYNYCTDTGLTNGTTYWYYVDATNSGGTSGPSAIVGAKPQVSLPGAPTLTGQAAVGKNRLSWTSVSTAVSYVLLRSNSTGTETDYQTGLTAVTYDDTSVTNGTTYYYQVLAVNSAGVRGNKSSALALTPLPPAPGVPTGISATAADTKVTVKWTAVNTATYYDVYRSLYPTGDYNFAKVTGCSGSTFTATTCVDTAVTNATSYFYKVAAANAGGVSALSDPSVGATPAAFTITYSPNVLNLLTGQTLNPTNPSGSSGHSLASCKSNPTLPNGLQLSESCALLGVPNYAYPTTVFQIIGTDSNGAVGSGQITITIKIPAPKISYSYPNIYPAVGEIQNLAINYVSNNTLDSCSSTPALPAGLSIDKYCTITGAPTTEQAPTAYTMTAVNSGGTGTTQLTIEVIKGSVISEINAGVSIRQSSGTVYAWDPNSHSFKNIELKLNRLADFVPGYGQTIGVGCALLPNGTIQCDGYDNFGLLGNGQGSCGYSFNSYGRSPVLLDNGDIATSLVDTKSYTRCAILSTGKVKCWGDNTYGKLGNNSTASCSNLPVTVSFDTADKVTSLVSNSVDTICALLDTGKIKCWGNNYYGSLGNGTTTDSAVPVSVSLGSTEYASQLVAGYYGFCTVLKTTGKIKCWGSGGSGELGNGSYSNSNVPVAVTLGTTETATALVAKTNGYCAITNLGTKCWGSGSYGELGNGTTSSTSNIPVAVNLKPGSTAVALSSFSNGTCAALNTGEVQCWGANNSGILGLNPLTSPKSGTPQTIPGLTSALKISADSNMACAMTGPVNSASAYCWGGNRTRLMTGEGPYGGIFKAQNVIGVTGVIKVVEQCALQNNGKILCWGPNYYGQLGNGTTLSSATPTTVALDTTDFATDLVSMHTAYCALLRSGSIKCWGKSDYGNLGNGQGANSTTPVLVKLANGELASKIAVSFYKDYSGNDSNPSVCATTTLGGVRCWGYGSYGELGNGATDSSNTPVAVSLDGSDFASTITAGSASYCVTLSAGGIKCWGNNSNGMLGNGQTTSSNVPVSPVLGQNDVYKSILYSPYTQYSANQFFCGIMNSGKAKCWGDNRNGNLGNGTTSYNSIPVSIKLDSNETIQTLVLGNGVNCALLNTGAIKCWGFGGSSLGDGNSNNHLNAPTKIGLDTADAAIALAGNGSTFCAALSSGAIKCWGSSSNGELGNGTSTASPTPVAASLSGGDVATSILTYADYGYAGFCATLSGGSVKCWGNNYHGELGDGTTTSRNTPTLAVGVSDAASLSSRSVSNCAILNSGGLQCWGDNSSQGWLGNGQEDYLTVPKKVISP